MYKWLPSPSGRLQLAYHPDMIKRFSLVKGLSDHTIDNTSVITSVALGASLIEKHFTLDRNGGGPDDSFSLEPAELAALCRDTKTAWQALGQVDYGRKSSEQDNVQFRRSLYFVKDLKAGDVITEDGVRSVRPGYELAPKMLVYIIGQRVIKCGVPDDHMGYRSYPLLAARELLQQCTREQVYRHQTA
ncbi:N-acetylneuraminate synthase family protein [Halomonas sp. CH40]